MEQQSNQPGTSRTKRVLWPAIVAVGVATALAGAGMTTAQASDKGAKAAKERLQPPRLDHGRLTVDGGSGNDTVVVRLQAGHPETLEVDADGDGVADFSFKRADVTALSVKGGSGDDVVRIDESGGVFTDRIPTTIDGGSGDDRLIGGSGNETFAGGSGNDFADGNRGSDSASMGSGTDTFQWDPGDGSDSIEGDSGEDTMLFNGANVPERVDLSANGNRLRFTRDVAGIVMDTHSVERVDFIALGGADNVTVNDLAGTDVDQVNVDLGAVAGGAGDGAADRVSVNGTNSADVVHVAGNPSSVTVSGLAASVTVLGGEAANDRLGVNGLAGDDVIEAAGVSAGAIALTLDGGAGNDSLLGGAGNDTLLGGPGVDVLDGGPGSNVLIQD